ncbi:MAG: helix-turn-helix domain-containing protein [Proteobacteria bacterium]|nr:helix-turn-helix domain-containing protein [Pseudomonadota bacterium]
MPSKNALLLFPPHMVEQACYVLGNNLRTARLRRGITISEAAERIGTGPRAVMDAEKGKISTGIAVYAALLWLYDLPSFNTLAHPNDDEEGLRFASLDKKIRARKRKGLDNDF